MELTSNMQAKLNVLRDAANEYGGPSDEVHEPLTDFHSALVAGGSTAEVWLANAYIQWGPPGWLMGYAHVSGTGWCVVIRESTGFSVPNDEDSPRLWADPQPLLDVDRSYRYSAIQMFGTLVAAMVAP